MDQKPAVRKGKPLERQPADDKGPAGDGHALEQTTHVAHILRVVAGPASPSVAPNRSGRAPWPSSCVLVASAMLVRVMEAMLDAVDHAARAEEEQRLEEGMRDQVEEAGHIGADARSPPP